MASNTFGSLFSITTWGESHGKAIGVVIDGCPAGVPLDEMHVSKILARRAPGQSAYTSPRHEKDQAQILSGVFEGHTTGCPINILIENTDADSRKYESIKDMLRPGHANFTYLQKFGIADYRGGGRASARETACRVAAGAVAQRLLEQYGVTVATYLEAAGKVTVNIPEDFPIQELAEKTTLSPLFTPDKKGESQMGAAILEALKRKDSLGGVVAFRAEGVPVGLGEPVYGKIDALLAGAMMSIPAAKGFEIGRGFDVASMYGSECNDQFLPTTAENAMAAQQNGTLYPCTTATNYAGGCLGGITTGMPLYGRVAFKPTPSIGQPLPTADIWGNPATFTLPQGSRHDPCVAVRAVPVVEAMCLLVLADALLMHRARVNKAREHAQEHK